MATMTISLPDPAAKKLDMEAKKLGYATRSEFVRSLLRKYFAETASFELEEFKPVSLHVLKAELAKSGKYSEKFIESVIKGFKKSSVYAK